MDLPHFNSCQANLDSFGETVNIYINTLSVQTKEEKLWSDTTSKLNQMYTDGKNPTVDDALDQLDMLINGDPDAKPPIIPDPGRGCAEFTDHDWLAHHLSSDILDWSSQEIARLMELLGDCKPDPNNADQKAAWPNQSSMASQTIQTYSSVRQNQNAQDTKTGDTQSQAEAGNASATAQAQTGLTDTLESDFSLLKFMASLQQQI